MHDGTRNYVWLAAWAGARQGRRRAHWGRQEDGLEDRWRPARVGRWDLVEVQGRDRRVRAPMATFLVLMA